MRAGEASDMSEGQRKRRQERQAGETGLRVQVRVHAIASVLFSHLHASGMRWTMRVSEGREISDTMSFPSLSLLPFILVAVRDTDTHANLNPLLALLLHHARHTHTFAWATQWNTGQGSCIFLVMSA